VDILAELYTFSRDPHHEERWPGLRPILDKVSFDQLSGRVFEGKPWNKIIEEFTGRQEFYSHVDLSYRGEGTSWGWDGEYGRILEREFDNFLLGIGFELRSDFKNPFSSQ